MSRGSQPIRTDAEQDLIMEVIEAETEAFLRRDLDGWASLWVQDERAQHVSARPSVGVQTIQGFDRIRAFVAWRIESVPENGVQPPGVRRENWRFSIRRDMAWVTFDQVIPLEVSRNAAPGRHTQMRILERIDGQWKIAGVWQAPNRIGYYDCPWVRVDRGGRVLETSDSTRAALADHRALRIVGPRLCGRHPSDTRRLHEAIAEADDLIRSWRNRPPVPLILTETADGSVALCWISIADMMIVVLIEDTQLLSQTIDRAGEAFRLSAAQKRVAEAIARGNDLNRAAEVLGVRPSTVRTHVKRMFERVGVSSQTALMRALLSLNAPYPRPSSNAQ